MNPDITIEKINKENFNEFLWLVEKLAEYEKLNPPDEEAKARLRKDGLSKNPKYEAYLAKINQKYVGYIIYFMCYSSFLALSTLYLEDIFVLKEFRKKGIGKKLFEFCVSKAKEKKCGRIEWHVLDWNKTGINFYEKNNAKHLSNWLYYRLDKEKMEEYN
jgi:GNAT superfamily N-acetyltransferase